MGKIGLEYSECNNLIKRVKKCKENIEFKDLRLH